MDEGGTSTPFATAAYPASESSSQGAAALHERSSSVPLNLGRVAGSGGSGPLSSLQHAASTPFPGPTPSLALGRGSKFQPWRDSSALTDRTGSLGIRSLKFLCGRSYVDSAHLKKIKTLGEGAFATVETAYLSRPGALPEGVAAAGDGRQVVAVKRLKAHVLLNEDDVFRFVAEASLLVQLRHTSIIRYIGMGAEDTSCQEAEWRTMFLVQEYANAGTVKHMLLKEMISPRKRLFSQADALRWSLQIGQALEYLHSHNPMVIHRDLKSENILLTGAPGEPLDALICDFGLHKLIKLNLPADSLGSDIAPVEELGAASGSGSFAADVAAAAKGLSLTLAESTVGEDESEEENISPEGSDNEEQASPQEWLSDLPVGGPEQKKKPKKKKRPKRKNRGKYVMTGKTGAFIYMAPEVLLGKACNEKVDCFSLGVVMYEVFHRQMILASLMYTGDPSEAEEYAYKVANGFRLPVSESLPEALRRLITSCMASDPDLRPSMQSIVKTLQEITDSGSVELAAAAPAAGCCSIS